MKVPAGMFAHVVDGTDIGMVEGRGGRSLALKALDGSRAFGKFLGEKFDGNVPSEAGIFRFVDDSHAAAAEFAQNAIVRDGFVEQAAGRVFLPGRLRVLWSGRASKLLRNRRIARLRIVEVKEMDADARLQFDLTQIVQGIVPPSELL